MLIPENIRPENSLYYNGGKVLEVMLSEKQLSIGDLYVHMRENMNISMATLMLSLDWLYLLGCLEVKDGEVALCL